MTKYNILLSVVLLLLFSVPVAVRGADEKPVQNQRLMRLHSELETLFRHYYPKITSQLLDDSVYFEHDIRLFMIHGRLMTGEWKEASEVRGPNQRGILCDISLREGQWEGQAAVPQTFDNYYFKGLLMAPYSAKHDAHLMVHLSYPDNVNEDFLKEFTTLIEDFSKYID